MPRAPPTPRLAPLHSTIIQRACTAVVNKPVSGLPALRRLTDLAERVGWTTNQQVKRYLSAGRVA